MNQQLCWDVWFIDQESFPFPFSCADMFPATKRRHGSERTHGPAKKRKMSPGKPFRKDQDGKSPKRNGPGGPRDKMGKGWKKDGEKAFGRDTKPGRKPFGGKKPGERGEKKFGGKKTFDKNKDKSFKSKGSKGKPAFKKKGVRHGSKQRKGKGWSSASSHWTWT